MLFSCASFYSVLVTTAVASQSYSKGATLVRLAVVFRHGDRTPDESYPNDPYSDPSNWPDGLGHLTIKGKKRMLDVGRFVRKRYHNFLSGNPLEVLARSSPVSRCLSSAALVLAGAYPPSGRLVIDRSFKWQPTPVYTEREGKEAMLVSLYNVPCPASRVAEDLQQDADDVIRYQDENRDFMEKISFHSGSNISRLRDIETPYDNLKIDREEEKELPPWATTEVLQQMHAMDQKIFCVNSSTLPIQRLHAGLFYHDLGNVFLRDAYPGKKVFFYSTHDTRLSSMMRALNSYEGGGCPYGCTLFFELLQRLQQKRVIRVFFLRDTWNQTMTRLNPRLCDKVTDCPVQHFFEGLRNYTIDPAAFEKECQTFPTESQLTDCFT